MNIFHSGCLVLALVFCSAILCVFIICHCIPCTTKEIIWGSWCFEVLVKIKKMGNNSILESTHRNCPLIAAEKWINGQWMDRKERENYYVPMHKGITDWLKIHRIHQLPYPLPNGHLGIAIQNYIFLSRYFFSKTWKQMNLMKKIVLKGMASEWRQKWKLCYMCI